MKICITGGAGFIGHHTVNELLGRGHEILVLDNLSTGRKENLPEEVPFVDIDILDDRLKNYLKEFHPDAVLHLAAMVTIRGSVDQFSEDARQNFQGTAKVIEASIRAGIKRFVFTSSMAVYADAPDANPINEAWLIKPLSPYGISKYASEELVHMMGKQAGFETMVLRLFNTYGTGQISSPYVGVINIFLEKLLGGEAPKIFGDGNQCRDFIYVGDVSRACRLALESKASGHSVNIGTGRGTTVNELARMLMDKLDSPLVPEYSKIRSEENRFSVADGKLAKEVIGFEPEFRLEDKVPEIIEYKRSELKV